MIIEGFGGPQRELCRTCTDVHVSPGIGRTVAGASHARLTCIAPDWTHKLCPGCKFIQPREDFCTQSRCKACRAAYFQENRERIRDARRDYYHKNREQSIAKTLRYKRQNPELYKDYERKFKYGLQPGEYAKMLAAQGGLCAICRRPHPKPLHVDHCHVTGVVRALLCDLCNRGLGYFHDDPEQLEAAASYLRGFR